MSAVIPFAFGDTLLRCVMRDGNPWFVAKDVCNALDIKNHRDAVTPLDEDEKGVVSTDTLGGPQEVLIVSESGFYTIVLRSRQATTPGSVAHRFRKWVTSEVLPSLRRTGTYTAPARREVVRDISPDRVADKVRRVLSEHGPMSLTTLTYYTPKLPAAVRHAAINKLETEGALQRWMGHNDHGPAAMMLRIA